MLARTVKTSDQLKQSLTTLAERFANDLLAAIRSATVDELLEGPAPSTSRSTPVKAPPPVANRSGRKARTEGTPRVRRGAEQIQGIVDSIVKLLKKNPKGLRAEHVRDELGIDAKDLVRPIREALDQKAIKKKGQKRATVYFAA